MEKYKIIPNTNDRYEISDLSNIRRVKSRVKNSPNGGTRSVGGKVLSQKTKKNKYKEVALYINNQKCTMKYVHRLMYETFVGEIPSTHQINHIDGNKSNNLIDNLELVTPSENMKHSYHVLGNKLKAMKGQDHRNAKLSDDEVILIKKMYSEGVPSRDIHKSFSNKVSLSSLRKVCYGLTWKHIQ